MSSESPEIVVTKPHVDAPPVADPPIDARNSIVPLAPPPRSAPSGMRVVPDYQFMVPGKSLELTRFSEMVDEPIEWLWPQRVPLGKLTLLAGDPGLGKSFVAVDWVARITRGACWPGEPAYFAPQGSAVLLSAEDKPEETTRQRLVAAGADLTSVAALKSVQEIGATRGRPFSLRQDLDVLEMAVDRMPDCRLVVIDPITAYMDGIDDNRNGDVRTALQPLAELAARRRVAVLAITHLNKNTSRRAIYRTMGSLAFVAQARSVWGVVRDPADPDRRIISPVKNNVSCETRGLVFRVPKLESGAVPRVCWEMMAEGLSLETALVPRRFDLKEQEYRNQESYCVSWLRDRLSEGAVRFTNLEFDARDFSRSQLHRASVRLGVMKLKEAFDGSWVWVLPEHYDRWCQTRDSYKRMFRNAERRDNKRRKAMSERMKARHAARRAKLAAAEPQQDELRPEELPPAKPTKPKRRAAEKPKTAKLTPEELKKVRAEVYRRLDEIIEDHAGAFDFEAERNFDSLEE